MAEQLSRIGENTSRIAGRISRTSGRVGLSPENAFLRIGKLSPSREQLSCTAERLRLIDGQVSRTGISITRAG